MTQIAFILFGNELKQQDRIIWILCAMLGGFIAWKLWKTDKTGAIIALIFIAMIIAYSMYTTYRINKVVDTTSIISRKIASRIAQII